MDSALFTYGTLRVDEPNSEILKFHSKFQETCITLDKFIMITQHSKLFPFIFPVEFWPEMVNRAVNVVGDLYNVDIIGIKRCDKLEGHPDWYKRRTITVKNITGKLIEVEAYILTNDAFNGLDKNRIMILDGDWKNNGM